MLVFRKKPRFLRVVFKVNVVYFVLFVYGLTLGFHGDERQSMKITGSLTSDLTQVCFPDSSNSITWELVKNANWGLMPADLLKQTQCFKNPWKGLLSSKNTEF
jgi:hypothetical protein